jgi:hypothetical protein
MNLTFFFNQAEGTENFTMNIEVCPAPGDAAPSIPAQHIAGPKGPDSDLVGGSPVRRGSSGHILSSIVATGALQVHVSALITSLCSLSFAPVPTQDIQVVLFWVTWALPCLEVSDTGDRQTDLAVLAFVSCRQRRSFFLPFFPS